MKLDVKSEIFQNLNGDVLDEVILVDTEDKTHMRLLNSLSGTYPGVVHGSGSSKVSCKDSFQSFDKRKFRIFVKKFKLILNRLGNYIAKAFSNQAGCLACKENTFELPKDVRLAL
jgi:hypothetical protein